MTIMLVAGAGNTIFGKLQFEQTDNDGNKYRHPYFMAINVFGAGALANLFYWVYKIIMRKRHGSIESSPDAIRAIKQGKKQKINALWLAIPAFFDFMAIPLMNLGLIMVSASVYQMLRGGLILMTAVSSIIFLKATLYIHHWTSLFFIVGGVVTVGVSSILRSSSDDNNIIGIVLILISQVLSAAHWIVEEKILLTYYIHPFRMVGLEGFFALWMSIVMVGILYFIPCNGSYCPNGRAEDFIMALQQMGENYIIIVYAFLLTVCITAFQISGVFVTKFGSSAQRWTIDVSRIIIIWAFFLIYQGPGNEKFDYIQFIGFIGIIIGTIMYNEIYVPSVLGFNMNTKVNKSKRVKESEEIHLLFEDDKINCSQSMSKSNTVSNGLTTTTITDAKNKSYDY